LIASRFFRGRECGGFEKFLEVQSRSDDRKLARHNVPGFSFQNKIRPEGTVEFISVVPPGRINFRADSQPRCGWLISDVPAGLKRGGKTEEALKKFLEARSTLTG
jgi:hypothetical protein